MRSASALLSLLALLSAAPLAAQEARTARVAGVVYDSITSRPLPGAVVTVVQRSPAPTQYYSATTDATGRYLVDSLAAGQFLVGFATGFLDSLEVQLPQRELVLGAGARAVADFATPSRTTLFAAACPGLASTKGRGAIVGQVMNAETDAPLANASLVVSWTEIGLDVKAMRPTSETRVAEISSDAQGLYRVCNLPTETFVVLQIQHGGKAGTAVRASIRDSAAVTVQHLSLSPATARELSASDTDSSMSRDTVTRRLTGTATLAGTVRGTRGEPLADAQVRIVDAASSARTDAAGAFSIQGLPAGTQLVEVRRVGYLVGQQAVELRGGRTVTQDLRLSRIVSLDSVLVVAERTKVMDRSRLAGGRAEALVFTDEQIAKIRPSETGDLVKRMLGFRIVGYGIDAKVVSTRGVVGLRSDCIANVVIDGVQHQDINLIPPETIGAIETYRGGADSPPLYDSACGVIVIWTKR